MERPEITSGSSLGAIGVPSANTFQGRHLRPRQNLSWRRLKNLALACSSELCHSGEGTEGLTVASLVVFFDDYLDEDHAQRER